MGGLLVSVVFIGCFVVVVRVFIAVSLAKTAVRLKAAGAVEEAEVMGLRARRWGRPFV